MAAKAEAGRVGRPFKEAREGQRNSLGLRVTADLKKRLDSAAKASGRSQSQEAELRLESSFERDRALQEMFGGAELINLFRMLAAASAIVEQRMGKTWAADSETFIATRAAWVKLINEMQPPPNEEVVGDIAEMAKFDWAPPPLLSTPREALVAALLRVSTSPEDQATVEAHDRDVREYEEKYAQWSEQAEVYHAKLQAALDHMNGIIKIGEQSADEALFPPVQGNG